MEVTCFLYLGAHHIPPCFFPGTSLMGRWETTVQPASHMPCATGSAAKKMTEGPPLVNGREKLMDKNILPSDSEFSIPRPFSDASPMSIHHSQQWPVPEYIPLLPFSPTLFHFLRLLSSALLTQINYLHRTASASVCFQGNSRITRSKLGKIPGPQKMDRKDKST